MPDRIGVIDGLRGSAILLVLMFHVFLHTHFPFGITLWNLPLNLQPLAQGGNLGVEIFFFVSGFCLMLPYAEYLCGRRQFQSWSEYASRRFWKIVPSYYLALAVVATLFPFDAQPGIGRLQDVLLHASFMHPFNAASYTSLNSNFWSLGIEVEFYALFPFIVLAFIRWPFMTTGAIVGANILYCEWAAATSRDGIYIWAYSLLAILPLFAVGGFTAYVYERYIRERNISRPVRLEMTAVAIVAVAAIVATFDQMDRVGGGPIVWQWITSHRLWLGVLLSVFTLSSLCATTTWKGIVGNPVLRFFSDISYNMYLWNALVVALAGMFWQHFPQPWQFSLVCFAGTTALGWILTYGFERPLMRRRLRIFVWPLVRWEQWRHAQRQSNA